MPENKSVEYKLRAECQPDIDQFIKVSGNQISDVKINKIMDFPDREMSFHSQLTLQELRTLMKGIPDSHVMSESLNTATSYTGERSYGI